MNILKFSTKNKCILQVFQLNSVECMNVNAIVPQDFTRIFREKRSKVIFLREKNYFGFVLFAVKVRGYIITFDFF